jgi:hypothetical protein
MRSPINNQPNIIMKKPSQIKEFGTLLDAQMKKLERKHGLSLNIFSITSPKTGGDIEIVFHGNTAITYRSDDGTFTGLSYWQELQI